MLFLNLFIFETLLEILLSTVINCKAHLWKNKIMMNNTFAAAEFKSALRTRLLIVREYSRFIAIDYFLFRNCDTKTVFRSYVFLPSQR